VSGADIDKEKESISVDQIAGKDDITNILRSLIVTTLLECILRIQIYRRISMTYL
jgi:hypothetical protein